MDRSNLALHDIKPLMQIPDNSLYLLIALILVGLVVLGASGYFLRYFLKPLSFSTMFSFFSLSSFAAKY